VSALAAPLREVERKAIETALLRAGWVIEGPRGAAKLLGLHPNTLRSRLQRLGIRRPAHEPS
jgi:formate hydrogenlyase transcriptional activator